MKKRLLILAVMIMALSCMLAISVFAAEPSYEDGAWIYADDDVTKLAIRDTEGNPLIWYMNGTELKYVRADQTDKTQDVYVEYKISAGGSGFPGVSPEKTLKDIDIYDNGTHIEGAGINSQMVLFNMEDLDIDALNGWLWGNKNGCCLLMRGMVFPSTLKYMGQEGLTNVKMVQYWNLENTQLEYINACNFGNCSTLTQEATDGVFICPKTLARPIEIQNSQVRIYVMNPYFNYVINVQWNQFFRSCKKLEKVICPSQVSMGFGPEAFRDTPTQYLLFVTGTLEDAQALIENTNSSHNGGMKAAKIISYEEYLSDQETYDNSTNQVYVVYGYNFCDAFYNGEHTEGAILNGCQFGCERNCGVFDMLDDPKHEVKTDIAFGESGYFSGASVCQTCANCKTELLNDTIDALFTSKGYAAKQFGDSLGITQGYILNRNAISAYKAYAPDFDFGILAVANKSGEAISPVPGGEGVVEITFDNMVNDYIDIKIAGIPEANKESLVVFCIYVTEGEKTYYLENGTTLESITGVSYSQVAAEEN